MRDCAGSAGIGNRPTVWNVNGCGLGRWVHALAERLASTAIQIALNSYQLLSGEHVVQGMQGSVHDPFEFRA